MKTEQKQTIEAELQQKKDLKAKHPGILSIRELIESDIPPIEYLIDDFLMKGGLTYVVGPSASFKTGILLEAVLCGAAKKKFLDTPIKKPFKTLWIDEENRAVNLKNRVTQLIAGNPDLKIDDLDNKVFFSITKGFQFVSAHINILTELIHDFEPDLVVIDSIARCLPGSERDEKDVNKILQYIKPLMNKRNVSFAIIHHTRKDSAEHLDDVAGSRDFGAMADDVFLVKQVKKTKDYKRFRLKSVKARNSIGNKDINFKVSGKDKLNVDYVGTTSESVHKDKQKFIDCKDEIKTWIEAQPDITEYKTKDFLKAFEKKYGERNVFRALGYLKKEKVLKCPKKGTYEVVC